jgi:nucleotide-binding universal stress UspA family protein
MVLTGCSGGAPNGQHLLAGWVVVCGSRGYGPVRRVLLGGVSSRVVRHSWVPVLAVPRRG